MWLNANVTENTLFVFDLEVVQVVYEPAALCSESLQTFEKSQEALLRDSSSGAAGFEAMSTSVEVAATHPLAMDIAVDARAR